MPVEEYAPQTSDAEENAEENDENEDTPAENGDNGGYRRRGGRRDRRGRFDRRRTGRRRSDGPIEGDAGEKTIKEEPVILYNSHENAPTAEQPANDGESTEKKKVAWWKKLING